jgi:hypothetical protein
MYITSYQYGENNPRLFTARPDAEEKSSNESIGVPSKLKKKLLKCNAISSKA